ncbi:hypothetical protein WA026_018933 [Henosepilachna vigintioctopunctata]|uniref:Protein arginine N-methyltransferase n=1 Tax=Henosepilachna vigintioctopunctata TaxID=420089 RepID=A0AAW1UEM7_9CUCU
MNVFIQKRNVITGSSDWVVENENYDYHQEVARSSFADMLHDTERNRLYDDALKLAIEKIHARGEKAIVLDIGTGTGLLSMMAIRNGADKVTACEAFKPMSECALKIIDLNGFKNKIKVIPKRSTELTVGENNDLTERCNILVTEVFDTELIGEGALSTFKHAHEVLLTKDCIVIPSSATVYAQVVECPLVHKWNRMNDIYDGNECLLKIPESLRNCGGCAAVHDIQLNQLPIELVKTLVSPTAVLQFDWSGKTPFVFERSTILSLKAECDGIAQALFMWWDLKMDEEKKIVLSCAPFWAHPLLKNGKTVRIPWRDHWMQAVYYFPNEMEFSSGDELNLLSCHDEYSLWFNIKKNLKLEQKDYLNPVCTCGFHLFPRTRIGQINDKHKNNILMNTLKHNASEKVILIISNGFYLSLIACKLNASKIYIFENNPFSKRVMQDFIKYNDLKNVLLFDSIEALQIELPEKSIDLVLAEPYFVTSILPWDNLFFYYSIRKIHKRLKKNVQIYPRSAKVKAIAVCFDDLHKIRTPLINCEGFKMNDFDKLIEESSNISDDAVEVQPLWEYPGTALSKVAEVLNIDFTKNSLEVLENKGVFNIEWDQPCNGIAIWMEWFHDRRDNREDIIFTGPILPPIIGEKISWDMNSRQGVCLFPDKKVKCLNYTFKLDLINGSVNFEYH